MDDAKRIERHWQMGQYFYDNYWAIPVASLGQPWASNEKVGKWPVINMGYPIYLEYITP